MAASKLTVHEQNGGYSIVFKGSLTEDTKFPPTDLMRKNANVTLELLDLKSINSTGIRSFMAWVRELPTQELFLNNCPAIFVHQLNILMNFLPEYARVRSFYVPFYCSETDEEHQVLYQRGIHYARDNSGEVKLTHPDLPDSKGAKFEIDVHADRYFDFLGRYA